LTIPADDNCSPNIDHHLNRDHRPDVNHYDGDTLLIGFGDDNSDLG
jgi:hypothetical protein